MVDFTIICEVILVLLKLLSLFLYAFLASYSILCQNVTTVLLLLGDLTMQALSE